MTEYIPQSNDPPFVCIAAPLICFFVDKFQNVLLGGLQIGSELLLLNGFLTYVGLLMISKKEEKLIVK